MQRVTRLFAWCLTIVALVGLIATIAAVAMGRINRVQCVGLILVIVSVSGALFDVSDRGRTPQAR
jgi:hypothetical protein